MSTITQLFNVAEEDLVLRNFIVSQVDYKDRSTTNQTNLTWITLVGGKSYTPLNSKLYFGTLSYEQLKPLRGQRVDLLLSLSSDGKQFNIKEIQPVSSVK